MEKPDEDLEKGPQSNLATALLSLWAHGKVSGRTMRWLAECALLDGAQHDELVSIAKWTRGAQGRARLQIELAAQKGVFFASVLNSMARRMQPTAPVEGAPQEMMMRGVCGTKYLERFEGFGKYRELGCLQYQVMTILDFLQMENIQGARDATALLAVTLDQAALDNGRFDLASLLCLQEEPRSSHTSLPQCFPKQGPSAP
eukprot:s1376_g13.t1